MRTLLVWLPIAVLLVALAYVMNNRQVQQSPVDELAPLAEIQTSAGPNALKLLSGMKDSSALGRDLGEDAAVENHLQLLGFLLNHRQDEEFLQRLEALIAQYPRRSELRALRADYFYMRQNWEAAEASLNAYLELEPDDLMAQSMLAETESHRGNLDAGLQRFENILAKDPEFLDALYGFVSAHDLKNTLAEARERIEKLRADLPHSGNIAMIYSDLLFEEGKLEERAEVLKQAIQSDPQNPGPLRYAAEDAKREGRYQDALRLSKEALRLETAIDYQIDTLDLAMESAKALGLKEEFNQLYSAKEKLISSSESENVEMTP